MDPRRTVSPESALASDIFDKFCSANTLKAILTQYRHLCKVLRLKPTHFPDFYPRLKAKLSSWRAQGLWSKFEKRASHKCYARGKACVGSRVLIIGAGPCGLRTAIEAQLLGAKVVIIEKRDRFSRNNVLHLWPFVITDLKALGAKKFYGKFCAGSIDHISIRQIQCILLKVALLLGVEVLEGVGFEGLREPTENEGWRAVVSPADHPVSHYSFDVLIGADGRRNTLTFKRKALRAKLAIAITANFLNKHTEAEARVKEISGVSYIFNQKFFQELNEATGIDLENIVYYKDETHYFVMTAKKQSLLNKGVLLYDHADTAKLLSGENISSEALMTYALEAAIFSTDNQLPDLDFAVNHYGKPDVAMFDFTAMYAAENACRVVTRKGHKLLMSLVGDSLLEPFWPTGSGCARGFLSSFDTCWMLRSWSSGRSVLEVIAERESIYRLLGQTTPENLNKEHLGYTIDPHSRYPNLNLRVVMPYQVKSLYDTDETGVTSDLIDGQDEDQLLIEAEKVSKKRRRESVIAVDSLLSWFREQVMGYGLHVVDIVDAFIRGDVLCAIINRFRPDLIEFPLPISSEENVDPMDIAACRNQIAFDLLHEEHGLPPVMSGFDSVQCPDFLTVVAYLSQIYEVFRGEIPQIRSQDSGEELEEYEQRSSHSHPRQHSSRPALVVKHTAGKISRRSRVSSSGRDGRVEGESESLRKHKKRRSDDRSRGSVEERENRRQEIERNRMERQRRRIQERILQTERFVRSMRLLQLNDRSGEISVSPVNEDYFEDYTFHLYRQMAPDFEDRCKFLEKKLFNNGREIRSSNSQADPEKQHVPGLAKNLEEKLKGSKQVSQKPKDLIRAIGKIEKSDWNVQLIEKKIAENKTHCQSKCRDDKVPKWSREAFDDKREAMKRKMEGSVSGKNDKLQLFEDQVKKLGSKLKEGNTLEVGQRGSNKVSQISEQLVNKCRERPKEDTVVKAPVQRPVFEFPKRGGSETCHFCNKHVYVVERMTTEKKFFHKNCFRCEYCNTSLRLGNYVFDREGRYGDRFYCTPHWSLIRLYGWKKYDQDVIANEGSSEAGSNLLVPTSQQILSEIDARGNNTPERIEFENSVDFASEEELNLLSEDEWTDRNCFGAVSNADNNTSDEASDLSDDEDDITPEGNEQNTGCPPHGLAFPQEAVQTKRVESSDSDGTEVASDEPEEDEEEISDDEEQEDDEDEDEEEDEEEEEEECGSTTEIETDSEFAEDPPHSVPGKIPTIVVDEPEQVVTKILEPAPLSHTQSPQKHSKGHHHSRHHHHQQQSKKPQKEEEQYVDVLKHRMVEPVKKNIPERVLPRVNAVPKKWQPLPEMNDRNLASKLSLELKQKYLHGGTKKPVDVTTTKKSVDSTAQNQFRSVLDMISEQQKLLQPAAKPSATMQAFLDNAEKLKQKQSLSPLDRYSSVIGAFSVESPSPINTKISPWSVNELERSQAQETSTVKLQNENGVNLLNMNRLNLEKTMEIGELEREDKEKGDCEKDTSQVIVNGKDTLSANLLLQSETPSVSQSETDTQSTIVDTNKINLDNHFLAEKRTGQEEEEQDEDDECEEESNQGSETESDDLDEEEDGEIHIVREPPRVEIEDEYGVTLNVDEEFGSKSLEIGSESEVKNENIRVFDEVEAGKNIGGMSSSSSKDSLNSGMFLETELSSVSEFQTRDGEDSEDIKHGRRKKKSSKNKSFSGTNKKTLVAQLQNTESADKYTKLKASLTLDLAGLDFMDMDGIITSPEEMLVTPKKQGYCKLANEEEADSDSDLNAIHSTNWNVRNDEDLSNKQHTSTSNSSRNSTPTLEGCVQDPLIKSSNEIIVEAVNPMVQFQPNPSKENKLSSSCLTHKDKFAVLDRVVPFSNARDSLDYRKMKSGSSPIKSKDRSHNQMNQGDNPYLFSQKQSLSLDEGLAMDLTPQIPETMNTLEHVEEEQEERMLLLQSKRDSDVMSMSSSAIGTSSTPLGIKHSNSESSIKSSSPSAVRRTTKISKEEEEQQRKDNKIKEINKERVKQSDLIRSMVMGRITRRSPEKNRRGSRGSLSPFASSSGSSEHFLKSDDQEIDTENDSHLSSQHSIQTSSNADTEVDESQGHTNSLENFVEEVNSSSDVSQTSSSGYSNGPSSHDKKNDKSTISHINSHYEPVFTSSPRFRNRPKFESPFMYNSVTNPPTPVNPKEPLFSPSTTPSTPFENHGVSDVEESKQKNRNKFYRSMPDLTAFLTPSSYGNPSGFSKVGKWEVCKSVTGFDREKARLAARERARLKSDHELGLENQNDYIMYKDKLRRKISVPEDDVFDPNAAVIVKTIIPSKSKNMIESTKNRPLSDIFDNVASSIRHNVDFPMKAKTNPFLVSPVHGLALTSVPNSSFSSSTQKDNNLHETNEGRQLQPLPPLEKDDFVHLQLRINPKNHLTERKTSPEKARSTGWELTTTPDSNNFPNYFTPATSSLYPLSHPPSNSSANDPTWLMTKSEGPTRSRSNTFSESGKSSSVLVLDDSRLTSPYLISPGGGEVPSTSLPDINCSPERKTKKPKDRERRRSIIQAVSDFFRSNGSPSSLVGNMVDMEKSNGSPPTKDKDKFSLFKLTPKLLHKDKRASSKSRETLSPGLSDYTQHDDSSLTPKLSKSSGFISYLSQPDMIIQRLSSSPTPFKSKLNLRYESLDSSMLSQQQEKTPQYTNKINPKVNEGYTDSLRVKEINEIRLSLEAIECEQRQLEYRGVSIEKKLKGEEKDEQNREDADMMEEWFTLVREKTRLARLARELTVRAEQLKLEERQSRVQEQLEHSMHLSDIQKTPDQKTLEVDLLNEMMTLENQKGNLLGKFHEDIQKYSAEDAELEAKIASSSFTPLESNV